MLFSQTSETLVVPIKMNLLQGISPLVIKPLAHCYQEGLELLQKKTVPEQSFHLHCHFCGFRSACCNCFLFITQTTDFFFIHEGIH